jgi:hypothetical protein
VPPEGWWRELGDPAHDPRLVCDSIQIYEVFRANGQWFPERIIN